MFIAAISQFARPKHPEKSLEELRRLLEQIRGSKTAPREIAEVRIQNVERRLGTERIAALLEAYASGLSTQAVAKEYGIGVATVNRLLHKYGQAVRQQSMPAQTLQQAIELYKEGLSVQRVAAQLGVPKSTLLRALKKAGVGMRVGGHH